MCNLEVLILGTSDAFSSGGRLQTAFLLRTEGLQVLVDCGATTLTALKGQGITVRDIDTIVLTHFHGDHFAGLPFLLLEMLKTGRDRPLTLITPPGGKAKAGAAMNLFYPGQAQKLHRELSVHYLEYKDRVPMQAGGLTLTAWPVIHTKETLPHGVRLELAGRVFAYSGDTEWTEALVPLSLDADLFICECCFFETEHKGHLSYRTLQRHRSRLHCKRLLLTHFDEELLAHLHEIGEETACDGQVISL